MKNKFKFIFSSIITTIILVVVLICIFDVSVIKTSVVYFLNGLGIYTEEIKNLEIMSDDYNEPGSWHINKSVKWISSNTARITFDVESIFKSDDHNKDIILVLDTSASMDGSRIRKTIEDSSELIDDLLSHEDNNIALITFNSTSTILSEFTNDKYELLNLMNVIETNGDTNYNAALKSVDSILENYEYDNERDVIVLFLTDGFPNIDNPNQNATYNILKDKYHYLEINGIQYEMGSKIIDDLKEMTDAQFVAKDDTLSNVLYEAVVASIIYEDFVISDYINGDYFEVKSYEDIMATTGEVRLLDESGSQKVVWDLGVDSFLSGCTAKMVVDVQLKDEFVNVEGLYPINEKDVIEYKLLYQNNKTINYSNSPVLNNSFTVTYDVNTPDGCNLDEISSEKYFVFDKVTKKTDNLYCEGYNFNGWEFEDIDDDVVKVNDNIFIMPDRDINIRATWTKHSIDKTMDGTVYEKTTLYKVLENEAKIGDIASEYIGAHMDSMDTSKSDKNIYHYDGSSISNTNEILDKNNVLFGDYCWQMIRTTDTGGVKLLYNGKSVNNKCLSDRTYQPGFSSSTQKKANSEYYYGTDYIYDSTSNTFKLSGDIEAKTYAMGNINDFVGKYTCLLTTPDAQCSNLYLVLSEGSLTNYLYFASMNTSNIYSQIGRFSFNNASDSPTYSGYKYSDVDSGGNVTVTGSVNLTKLNAVVWNYTYSSNMLFADSYVIQGGWYYLPADTAYTAGSVASPSDLIGKYTLRQTSTGVGSSSISYVIDVVDSTIYYINITNSPIGNALSVSDSMTLRDDGVYILNNYVTYGHEEWVDIYDKVVGKYTCNSSYIGCNSPLRIISATASSYTTVPADKYFTIAKSVDGLNLVDYITVSAYDLVTKPSSYSTYKYTCGDESTVCTEANLRYIRSFYTNGYNYINNYNYGSSVTWDGTNYTLVDTVGLDAFSNTQLLSTHHYTCPDGKKTCPSVMYVYNTNTSKLYYLNISDGILSINDKINKMLSDNKYDSYAKTLVESWYKKNLLNYDKYIEDAIYCNDRSIKDLGSFNPNGGSMGGTLKYKYADLTTNGIYDLGCDKVYDRFSVSNDLAKTNYKVGLLTAPEFMLLNHNTLMSTSNGAWLMSPMRFTSSSYSYYIYSTGKLNNTTSTGSYGIRPVISLIPGIEYSYGDGSMENPYVIDLNQ